MNWIAISGSWRIINEQVKSDVCHQVSQIIKRGDGIIAGGALGVDCIATNEALKHNPQASQICVFLPTSLAVYKKHYFNRAREGVIATKQAHDLIDQLTNLQTINTQSLIEGQANTVDQDSYYQRNSTVIDHADQLIAFQVNHSQGTGDTINKARNKGIPVALFSYTI